ncbi:hypothetical protein [Thomasclavelia cocleata]|uniref:hypothetical protein n=1 Tax=Thomasclavelia cocleata TaxID=69824 RepID=UPI00242A6E41|nr:hypothetical protein [Thomasclavelia cocleata]
MVLTVTSIFFLNAPSLENTVISHEPMPDANKVLSSFTCTTSSFDNSIVMLLL